MGKTGYRRKIFAPDKTTDCGVLLFGQAQRAEFIPLRHELHTLAGEYFCEVTQVRFLFAAADFSAFLRRQAAQAVAAAIFLQSYPGEFPPSMFRTVRALFPLTPILLIAGDLCEGAGRTGPSEPGVIRFYRRQWKTSVRAELAQYLRSRSGRLALPPTATDEDAFFARPPQKSPLPPTPDDLPVAIPFPGAHEGKNPLPPVALITPADPVMGEFFAIWARKNAKTSEFFTVETLLDAVQKRGGVPERIIFDSVAANPADDFPTIARLAEAFAQTRIDVLTFVERFSDETLFAPLQTVRLISKPFDPLFC